MSEHTPPGVLVISGTVGSGKNAALQGILDRCKNCTRLVTATTRDPRPGELHGQDYYFMSEEEFMKAKDEGLIPEHRYVETGAHYGVYTPVLDDLLSKGQIILAQVDIVGAKYLKEAYGAITIFIKPESFDSIEKRVRARQEMSDEEWEARKIIAEREITQFMPWYDHIVENPDGKLEESVEEMIEIMKKEGYGIEA